MGVEEVEIPQLFHPCKYGYVQSLFTLYTFSPFFIFMSICHIAFPPSPHSPLPTFISDLDALQPFFHSNDTFSLLLGDFKILYMLESPSCLAFLPPVLTISFHIHLRTAFPTRWSGHFLDFSITKSCSVSELCLWKFQSLTTTLGHSSKSAPSTHPASHAFHRLLFFKHYLIFFLSLLLPISSNLPFQPNSLS